MRCWTVSEIITCHESCEIFLCKGSYFRMIFYIMVVEQIECFVMSLVGLLCDWFSTLGLSFTTPQFYTHVYNIII